LTDADARVRCLSAIALQSMGAKSAPAVPQLVQALHDPVNYVRMSVANALGAIGPSSRAAVPALVERLRLKDEEDGFVLACIAHALGQIGTAAKEALPTLREVVDRRRVGAEAQEAILEIEAKPVPRYH
ncbi:MAG: HEAT repeat domain-containing protein, partial [Terriglobales bacterium]